MLWSPRSLACCFFLQLPQYILLSSTTKVFQVASNYQIEILTTAEILEEDQGDLCLSSIIHLYISLTCFFLNYKRTPQKLTDLTAVWITLVYVKSWRVFSSPRSWGLQLPMRRSGLGRRLERLEVSIQSPDLGLVNLIHMNLNHWHVNHIWIIALV